MTADPVRRIDHAEQDGFTVCIADTAGYEHCFRIDKALGAELCRRVNNALTAQELGDLVDFLQDMLDDEPHNPEVQEWGPIVAKLRAQAR